MLVDGGVPCYAYPSEAARTLAALDRHRRLRARPQAVPQRFDDVDARRARTIVESALRAQRSQLGADEVAALFGCYGIPMAASEVVEDAESAVQAAQGIGYPVVVKVDAEAASHKSDVGGVAIDLADAQAVRAAVSDMQGRLGHLGALRFQVQKFVPGGQELIVGATRAGALGHMLMFGLGGVHVEVLGDVVFRLCPVSAPEAQGMLAAIRATALLDGVRGRPPLCKSALVELMQRLSMMLADLPEIEELDLNPVLAFADSVCAVDGRIRVGAPASA